MCQLLFAHALTRICYRYLDIIGCLLSRNSYAASLRREFTGIIGQGVQHKERQHTICLYLGICGLHIQGDTFHGKGLATMRHQVEERLQGETLNLEIQFTLTELYPLSKNIIVIVDLVCKFTDIGETLLLAGSIEIVQTTDFVNDSIDKWRNTIDEGNLSTLLQMTTLVIFQTQLANRHIILSLFKFVFELAIASLFLLIQMVKEQQQEYQENDGYHHCRQHNIQLAGTAFILRCTSLQLTVLTGFAHQIDISIAVFIAQLFFIHRRIHQT